MPRDRLGNLRGGIVIPVMPLSMTEQYTPFPLDGANEVGAFHQTTNSPTLRTEGMTPLEIS